MHDRSEPFIRSVGILPTLLLGRGWRGQDAHTTKHGLLLLLSIVFITGCANLSGNHGAYRKTDRSLDLAINGDGFFIVQTTAGGFLFTRNGELSVSATGEIVNDDGYRLYPPISVAAKTSNVIVTPDGVVRTQREGETAVLVGQIVLSRFADAGKLERDGGYNLPTEASGDPVSGRPGAKGLGTLMIGQLEAAK